MSREQKIGQLIESIAAARSTFRRIPEADAVMDSDDSVGDFDKVMATNHTINYAANLDWIHRARGEFAKGVKPSVLDLCCGPGHLSLSFVKYLGYESVVGVDLSAPMIGVAQTNARKANVGTSCRFEVADVHRMAHGRAEKFDLVSFTNSAHHFPSINSVRDVLRIADQAAKPEGIIVMTDLCRLPSREITENFVSTCGDDYLAHGMHAMFNDFKASMLAAWSADELAQAIPYKSNRVWYQVVSGALPFLQGIFGLPVGRETLFVRESKDWVATGIHRSERAIADWNTTRGLYYAGMIRRLDTPAAVARAS